MPSICLRRIHVKQLHISCLHNLAVQWCSRRKQRLSCPVQQEGKRKLVAWGREGGRERGREGGRLPFPSSLPHAFFAFLHSQFLCSVPFKPISHRLTRQFKKYESFHIFPFILQTHNTCSPVGLVSLMDRVLCPVIAKVRVRFLVKSDFFHVLFQPPRLFISLWGSFLFSWNLWCFSLAAFMFEYQLKQASMQPLLTCGTPSVFQS